LPVFVYNFLYHGIKFFIISAVLLKYSLTGKLVNFSLTFISRVLFPYFMRQNSASRTTTIIHVICCFLSSHLLSSGERELRHWRWFRRQKFVCPSLSGTYADIFDCSSFYICVRGKANRRKCNRGTRFDKYRKTCLSFTIAVCDKGKILYCYIIHSLAISFFNLRLVTKYLFSF